MKTRTTAIALAVFAASPGAFAADFDVLEINHRPEFVEFTNVPSVKTPAKPCAELQDAQAKGQGQLTHQPEFVEFSNVASTKTRDEVRQEMLHTARREQ